MQGQWPLHHPRHQWHQSQPREGTTHTTHTSHTQVITINSSTLTTDNPRNPETNPKSQTINNNINNTEMEQRYSSKPRSEMDQETELMAQPWGHQIQLKKEHMIQILLQNIGSIDLMSTGLIKLAAMWTFTQAMQVDICTPTECNTDWNKALAHQYPAEQAWYWWESSQWKVTHNTQH